MTSAPAIRAAAWVDGSEFTVSALVVARLERVHSDPVDPHPLSKHAHRNVLGTDFGDRRVQVEDLMDAEIR